MANGAKISIKEIAEKYNFYVPGDMKKMYKEIKQQYDVCSITHNPNYMGMGVARTTIEYWVESDSEDSFFGYELHVEHISWG